MLRKALALGSLVLVVGCHGGRPAGQGVTPGGDDAVIGAGPDTTASGPRIEGDVAHFTVGSDKDGVSYLCRLDSFAAEELHACPNSGNDLGLIIGGLGEGSHFAQIIAVDEDGNEDPTPVTLPFNIDRTAPETRCVITPLPVTSCPTTHLVFDSNEHGANFNCVVDGEERPCNEGYDDVRIPFGHHVADIYAIDQAGNRDDSPCHVEWTNDESHAGDPWLTLNPRDVDFGEWQVGHAESRTITVGNYTDYPTGAISFAITGSTGSYAVASTTCADAGLSPHSECSVTVRASAEGTGEFNGVLTAIPALGTGDFTSLTIIGNLGL